MRKNGTFGANQIGMGTHKIAFLTSSRADFSIYLPVIRAFRADARFSVTLIAFGSHTSEFHGYTLPHLQTAEIEDIIKIDNLAHGDTPWHVAQGQANTFRLFGDLWREQHFDLVFCLGDRFEMAAAVLAGLPFGVRFAHLHGGETSLGAIDNVYRHSISLASQLHFVSCDDHAQRLSEILGSSRNIVVSGAPALDNLRSIKLLGVEAFQERFGVDMSRPTILITLHPETVAAEHNARFVAVFCTALAHFPQQLLITRANADTNGSVINKAFERFAGERAAENVHIIDTLGTEGYYSALWLSKLVVGNSSSGLIEAASFGKYVVDVGDRQKGRKHGDNVLHSAFDEAQLVATIKTALTKGFYTNNNIFDKGNASEIILRHTFDFLAKMTIDRLK